MAEKREAPASVDREAKSRLRKTLFSWLGEWPPAEKAAASRKICDVIASRPEFQSAAAVGAFVPLASEPDLKSLIRNPLPERNWCLPRVPDGGEIEYRKIADLGGLVTGAFKIREPDPARCPLFPGSEIDLLLVPGVGFDPGNRARLGRGKGHYDRLLEALRVSDSPPLVWGVCFAGQLTSLAPESHDQPMDAILTEDGFAG